MSMGMVTVFVVTLGMVTMSVLSRGTGHSVPGHTRGWSLVSWSHVGLVTVSVGMVIGSVVTPGGGHSVRGAGHNVHGMVTVPLGVVTLSVGVVTLSVLTRGIVHSVRGTGPSVRAPWWGSSHPRCQAEAAGRCCPARTRLELLFQPQIPTPDHHPRKIPGSREGRAGGESAAGSAERALKARGSLALFWCSALSITCSIIHPLLQLIYQRPNISARKHFISAFIPL